jgi:2-iminobutanoate/2-iminopropanoate deaminase
MKSPISAFAGSPPALGPYSLGVVAEGRFVFVSGMTPYDPEAGKIDRGTIACQTELVIANMRNVLAQAGATLEDVVSCRVYLAQLTPENFQEMNAVYARYFDAAKPARATIGAQLPPGFDVEIECIAVLPEH